MNAYDQDDFVNAGQVLTSSCGSRIEFGKKLGSGAYGQVFEGRIQKTNGEMGEVLAVKFVPFEEGEQSEAQEEIEILNMCVDLKNVMTLKMACTVNLNDQNYQLMGFEKYAISLGEMIQNRKINIPNAVKTGYIVLEVFAELEKLGILYQDLHAGNLLFCHKLTHMKIADFGMAEVTRKNKKANKKGNNYIYLFDAASVALLLLSCRGAKILHRPAVSISAYINEMKTIKESLLDNESLFMMPFVNELIDQLRSQLSYAKLKRALTTSLLIFDSSEPFIITPTVPAMLA
ncbi:unnamed protein product [Caenorhabditis nigoni]